MYTELQSQVLLFTIHLSGILPAVFEPSMIIKYITLTLFLSKGDVYVLFFGILGGFWRLLWYPGGLLIVPANKVWQKWCRVTPEAAHKGLCISYSVLWSTGYGGGWKSCKKSGHPESTRLPGEALCGCSGQQSPLRPQLTPSNICWSCE